MLHEKFNKLNCIYNLFGSVLLNGLICGNIYFSRSDGKEICPTDIIDLLWFRCNTPDPCQNKDKYNWFNKYLKMAKSFNALTIVKFSDI